MQEGSVKWSNGLPGLSVHHPVSCVVWAECYSEVMCVWQAFEGGAVVCPCRRLGPTSSPEGRGEAGWGRFAQVAEKWCCEQRSNAACSTNVGKPEKQRRGVVKKPNIPP